LMFTHEYDSDGRLTKIKPANSDYPKSEMVYAYDDAGRSLSITNTANGDRTDFEYDDVGRKIGIQRFDPKTLERSRSCAYAVSAWDAATSGAGVPDGGTIMTIYDEDDRPTEMQTRDAHGQIISRVVRTYNASGLLIEEKPIVENPAPMFFDRVPTDGQEQPTEAYVQALNKGLRTLMSGRAQSGTWHTYDAQNRIKTVREINFAFEKTTEIIYNERGDTAEWRRTVSGNSVLPIGMGFSVEDDGTLTPSNPSAEPPESPFDSIDVFRYSYQYDDHGNWTELTSFCDKNSEVASGVSRRMLTYF